MISSPRAGALAVGLVVCTAVAALSAVSRQARPGQQQPPRDAAQARRVVGTASISGQVVALDTGRPLNRARVVLAGAEVPDGRAAMTDQSGRYVLENLPAGRYTLTASKSGFVSFSYGARRPGRAGKTFELADGMRATGVNFSLPRGSVVTGHIYDEDGEPLIGAQVRVLRFSYVQGERRLTPAGTATTDDRGEFRVFNLLPGTYYAAATARPFEPVTERSAQAAAGPLEEMVRAGFAPTYYPGVTSVADAMPIVVGLQQEAPGIDFVLQSVSTARVMGTVVGPDGVPATNGAVTLTPDEGAAAYAGRFLGASYSGGLRPDGSFVITNVPPGRYVAFARGTSGRNRDVLFATQNVVVGGSDVTGAHLTLTAGSTVSGTVLLEASTATGAELSRVRVGLTPTSSLPVPTPQASGVLMDGSFTLAPVIAGSYLLRVTGLPRTLALKGAYYGARDVTESPLEVRADQNPSGVTVVLTDRVIELSGTVFDADGQPQLDYTVIAFSTDPSNWRPLSRSIQAGRPDRSGQFRLRGLPPGDYYVVAVDDVESGEWFDPAFLDGIRRHATSVSLGEGETKSLELKLWGTGGAPPTR